MKLWIVAVLVLVSCGSDEKKPGGDAGMDASTVAADVGPDAVADTGDDTGVDLGPDLSCISNGDCQSMDVFRDPSRATCKDDGNGAMYCSECTDDRQCGAGFGCRDFAYCEELPPCSEGSECAPAGSLVHLACVEGLCDYCEDDGDCGASEVCYSRLCAERSAVDADCLSDGASPPACAGVCDLVFTQGGTVAGVECVE